jgi:membrane associated rhomboid family serine protease
LIPIKDNVPTRHFPIVTVALIVANVLVWILYEHAGGAGIVSAVNELAYHPCEVEGSCAQVGEDWPVTAVTSMFMHASWAHIIGNMLFLWIFGNNVEDALGKVRFLVFYLLAGFAATALQTAVTLQVGSDMAGAIPNLGASGAVSGVLGAYLVLLPTASVLTILFYFLVEVPAFLFLGGWFAFQLWQGGFSLVQPETGGGVAFFAHIGGFVFGAIAVRLFSKRSPLRPAY